MIALMNSKDQLTAYSSKGLKAGCITRESSAIEKAEELRDVMLVVPST